MIRALLLALVATSAAAQDPPDLKGLRVGMSEQELLQAVPSLQCRAPRAAVGDRVCTDTKNTIVGHPAQLSATLIDDKTISVIVYFNEQHSKEVAAAITDKFGQPSDSRMIDARRMTTWNLGRGFLLDMSHLPGSTTGNWISLTDLPSRLQALGRMKEQRSRKAKDL